MISSTPSMLRLCGGTNVRELSAGYASHVDTVDERTWYDILQLFDDANIYQTWSYGAVRCGRQNISHLVMTEKGRIAACAQARIFKLPFIHLGIAYVRWGPVWRRRNAEANMETFRQTIRALRNEYACRRGLVLRLFPVLFDDDAPCFLSILKEEGFSGSRKEERHQTMLVDLSRSLGDLREGLRSHWHRYLKVAQGNGLEVIEGDGDELFEMFIKIYREMVSRKGLVESNDVNEFRVIQDLLPEKFKMKIMLCRSGDELCAGVVCSAIGKTAIYLFGATSDSGMKSRGSYLLHWKLIERLKQDPRVTVYDLNGINAKKNPGTYRFKNDLCGKNGRDVSFLGQFDSYSSVLSYSCVACGDMLRAVYRALWKTRRGGLALLDPRRRRRARVGQEHDGGNDHRRDRADDHRGAPAEASGRFAAR